MTEQQVAERRDTLTSQMAASAGNYNINEFVDGQKDCRDGVEHKAGMGESYDAGFSAQYQLEQMMGAA